MSDMKMSPRQGFAQRMTALCQWLCGGAPAAWCWANSSSGLMWVAPAATGLRFIYLGMEAGTQETQQDSKLALEAADITGNIKLLCRIRSLKWKLDHLHSHAFTLTLFPVPVLAFAHFLVRLQPICDYVLGNLFSLLKSNPSVKSATRTANMYVLQLNNDGETSKWCSPLPFICQMIYAAPHCQELPTDLYLFFIHLSVPNNLFSVTPLMFLDKQKLWEDVWG